MDAACRVAAPATVDHLARLRIGLCYLWRHGRLPALDRPRRFTEFVQHRKLHDRDPRMVARADKLAVKAIVAAELGEAWVTPTLWHGDALPAVRQWPGPLVVKARHGCNQNVFVRDDSEDWALVREKAGRWMRGRYAGGWLDEWIADQVPRGLIVESFVGEDGVLPTDFKFYVFGGRVAFIQVHLDREHAHRWLLFDRDWRLCSTRREPPPPPPRALTEMIRAAETLGRGFDFVRVDLYDLATSPRFGEMTFYPGSGLDPFDPPALDAVLGEHWAQAIR